MIVAIEVGKSLAIILADSLADIGIIEEALARANAAADQKRKIGGERIASAPPELGHEGRCPFETFGRLEATFEQGTSIHTDERA